MAAAGFAMGFMSVTVFAGGRDPGVAAGAWVLAIGLFISLGAFAVVHSLDHRRLRRALEHEVEARQEAEEALCSLAHDLKAPLFVLEHMLAVDQETAARQARAPGTAPSPEHAPEHAPEDAPEHAPKHVVAQMQALVDQVLRFVGVLRDTDAPAEASVRDVVREAMGLVATRYRGREVDWHAAGPDVTAAIAPKALSHVLLNLFDNAVKYGPERGALVRVTWTVGGRDPRRLVLEVADNGDGLEPGEREDAFRFLSRFPDRSGRDLPGTGVGLAFVRRLVNRFDGQVEADGAPEGGALFRVTLPVHRVFDVRQPTRQAVSKQRRRQRPAAPVKAPAESAAAARAGPGPRQAPGVGVLSPAAPLVLADS